MKFESRIENFRNNVYPKMEGRFKELESGQSPETLFITCSDSRIDPNLITQTEPGELFVIRNAGNIVGKPGTGELGVEATIQYAVDVLKVKKIVVCGHSHCGAVAGLMNLESLDALPVIQNWVKTSLPVLERVNAAGGSLQDAIAENVKFQLENLREHTCVANAIAANQLELEGWVYEFESGNVVFLDSAGEVA